MPTERPRFDSKPADQLSPAEYQEISSVIAVYRWWEILALRANIVKRVPPSMPLVNMYLPPLSTKAPEELHVRDSR